jgi:exodeoxyribonuclease III
MFSVLSWNIRQGGGTRLHAIVQHIKAQRPTVVILSEFHIGPTGVNLLQLLRDTGYTHQYTTEASPHVNTVLIASLLPGVKISHPESDPIYYQNILSVRFDALEVLGVYLPHKKHHQLLQYIHHYTAQNNLPLIIAGDYNTGINHVDQVGNSFWYEAEFKRLAEVDLHDAFRHLHGDQRVYSWFSHGGNGYRYDHTWVSGDLLPILTACHYHDEIRERRISDHASMWLKLG